jgi:hypothetical protein
MVPTAMVETTIFLTLAVSALLIVSILSDVLVWQWFERGR